MAQKSSAEILHGARGEHNCDRQLQHWRGSQKEKDWKGAPMLVTYSLNIVILNRATSIRGFVSTGKIVHDNDGASERRQW